MINTNEDIDQNKEQKKVIDELEEVLNFLKGAQITDEYVLINIKKPLSDLRSSLKYIPTETPFESIPTEIKTKILSYLCDTNAFTAASVCAEWKEILKSRFTDEIVTIGKRTCSYQCRDSIAKHLVSKEKSNMLEAAATHKINVNLSIDHSVREVDSKLVTDALTSVKSFSIIGDCKCSLFDDSFDSSSNEFECDVNPLSVDQFEDLFKGLERKVETMEKVKLECLDLTELNQDRLAHCFVNKIKQLTLFESVYHGENTFSVETVENLLSDTRPIVIKNLIIWNDIDFRTLINPEDLKKVCNKMVTLRLSGLFTVEQVKAARSLPDLTVSGGFEKCIEKGF